MEQLMGMRDHPSMLWMLQSLKTDHTKEELSHCVPIIAQPHDICACYPDMSIGLLTTPCVIMRYSSVIGSAGLWVYHLTCRKTSTLVYGRYVWSNDIISWAGMNFLVLHGHEWWHWRKRANLSNLVCFQLFFIWFDIVLITTSTVMLLLNMYSFIPFSLFYRGA